MRVQVLGSVSNMTTVRLAFYRTSSIGDVVLATACLDLLQAIKHTRFEVIWIGRQPSLSLISTFYPEVHCLEAKKLDSSTLDPATEGRLAQLHFVIDLQKSLRSHFACRSLSRAYEIPVFAWSKGSLTRQRLVLEARLRGRSKALPKKVISADHHQFNAMVEPLRRALEQFLPIELRDELSSYQPVPRLPIQSDDLSRQPWAKEMRLGSWLAVGPGAAHANKRAPASTFVEILLQLAERLGKNSDAPPQTGLMLLGDEQDRQIAVDILDRVNWPGPKMNLAGKLALSETPFALRYAGVLLANDTSLTHIAESIGTPVATLFGPTVEAFGFAPRDPRSRAFSVSLGCRPCSRHGKTPCRFKDQLCFKSLPNAEIAQFLQHLLISAQSPQAPAP